MVFPTFFNLSLNSATRSSWIEPQWGPTVVFADCMELFHLQLYIEPNTESATSFWTPLTGECWIPPKKDTPHLRAKEKASPDNRRGAVTLKIKSHTCQRCSKGTNKALCQPGPRKAADLHEILSQTCLWVFECLLQRHTSAVACHVDRGSCCSSPGRLSLWYKSSWRRLQLAPQQSHQAGDPQTGEQLQQRSSHTVAKILGSTTDFSTWGSSKGTENPQGILLWGPVGFHDRISTELRKQRLLEGTKIFKKEHFLKVCPPGTRRQELQPQKRLTQTCLWVSRSPQWRHGSTVACHGVWCTDYNNSGRHSMLE